MKLGVTLAQANADMARLIPVWMDSWTNGPGLATGKDYVRWRITPALRSLKQEVVGGVTDVLWTVMATIGLVLLVACANVTSLLLVRGEVANLSWRFVRRWARAAGGLWEAFWQKAWLWAC